MRAFWVQLKNNIIMREYTFYIVAGLAIVACLVLISLFINTLSQTL